MNVDLRTLISELQTHQAELEALNHELLDMQHKLEEARDRYADLYDYAPVGYFTFDRKGVVLEVNLAGASLLGVERGRITGRPFSAWVAKEDIGHFFNHLSHVFSSSRKVSVELSLKCSGGEHRQISLESIATSGSESVCRSVLVDVTERKKNEQMRYLAHFDALTGLPNRILFQDRFSQAIAASERSGKEVALLFLDLDRFKSINDTLGHSAGDTLLKHVADKLKHCIRKVDTVARLAGDEFVLLLPTLEGESQASIVAENILNALREPFMLQDHSMSISASIGITLFPEDGRNFGTLLRNADSAMYHAKKLGRNNFQFYTEEMNAKVLESLQVEEDLRLALKEGRLVLHYQPQFELETGKITGMEALIRWHRGNGWVSPSTFIPIAEERGLIVPIFNLVLSEVCFQIKTWQSMGFDCVPVAINVSALQVRRNGLVGSISHALQSTGISPACLELELTESSIMYEVEETVRMMQDLKKMGLKLSIDDFGIGYSSLSYLRSFPIHKLKIAQLFVEDLTSNSDAAAITGAIINMAKSLNLRVIAEGVETKEQFEYLKALGCDEIQGYYFSEAVPAEKITEMLKRAA